MKLRSTNVKVFPSAYREKNGNNKVYNPESRLNSEFNLTKLVNRSQRDSYVIKLYETTRVVGSTSRTLPARIECSIHGYYFDLDLTQFDNSEDNVWDSWNHIWAYINLEEKNSAASSDTTNTEYPALSLSPISDLNNEPTENALDVGNDFLGLEIVEEKPTIQTSPYSLKLLFKDPSTGTWKIPDGTTVIEDDSDHTETSINSELIYNAGNISNNNATSSEEENPSNDKSIKEKFTNKELETRILTSSVKSDLGPTIINVLSGQGQAGSPSDKSFCVMDDSLIFLKVNNDGTTLTNNDLIFGSTRHSSSAYLDGHEDAECSAALVFNNSAANNYKACMGTSSNSETSGEPFFRIISGSEGSDSYTGCSIDITNNNTIEFNKISYEEPQGGSAVEHKYNILELSYEDEELKCSGKLYPSSTDTYNIGSLSYRWNKLYTNTIELANRSGDYPYIDFRYNAAGQHQESDDYASRILGFVTTYNNVHYGALQFSGRTSTGSTYTMAELFTDFNSGEKLLKVHGNIISTNYIQASYFNATSDRRLKKDIKEYHCEKSILDLPVVEFKFKDSEEKHIGCIAQDLQEICPEIVHENSDGYLTIEENKLVYLLIDEVKKLKEEIKELKGE